MTFNSKRQLKGWPRSPLCLNSSKWVQKHFKGVCSNPEFNYHLISSFIVDYIQSPTKKKKCTTITLHRQPPTAAVELATFILTTVPWVTCAGSSGGTAGVVSSRGVAGGFCSDTAGSCRIPGAHTGTVGFRPSLRCYHAAGGIVPQTTSRDTVGNTNRV